MTLVLDIALVLYKTTFDHMWLSLKKKELKQYKSCIPENRKGGKYGEKKNE